MTSAAQLVADAEALQALLGMPEAWIQHRDLRHDYHEGQVIERRCLRGGVIAVTAGTNPRFLRLLRLVSWVLGPCYELTVWNDDPQRTHAEVQRLLASVVREARTRLDLYPLAPSPVDRIVKADNGGPHRRRWQDTETEWLAAIGRLTEMGCTGGRSGPTTVRRGRGPRSGTPDPPSGAARDQGMR